MSSFLRSKAGVVLASIAMLGLAGCSSFERDWKVAGRTPARQNFAKSDAFTGRWDGRWTSGKHKKTSGAPMDGRLRCLLIKLDENRYEARFKANWMVFASGYTTIFNVQRRSGELLLRGEHQMSEIFGGIYRYEGKVTPTHLSASYDSKYDHGVFEMSRPQSGR